MVIKRSSISRKRISKKNKKYSKKVKKYNKKKRSKISKKGGGKRKRDEDVSPVIETQSTQMEDEVPVREMEDNSVVYDKPVWTDTAFFIWGRLNPPHSGHSKLIERLMQSGKSDKKAKAPEIPENAQESNLFVFPTRTIDCSRNPLNINEKIDILNSQYPKSLENNINFINTTARKIQTIGSAVFYLQSLGYSNIVQVVGKDRENDFNWFHNAGKINGKIVVERGDGAMSATELRELIINKITSDEEKLTKIKNELNNISTKQAQDLIETIKNRMLCHGKGVCGGPKRKPVCKCNPGAGGNWCEL
jgi:nicotinic acid mononucleotide adenylyltransferase